MFHLKSIEFVVQLTSVQVVGWILILTLDEGGCDLIKRLEFSGSIDFLIALL